MTRPSPRKVGKAREPAQGWSCRPPWGVASFFKHSRKDALAVFAVPVWRRLYRAGWRCVRVEIREVLPRKAGARRAR